MSPILKPNLKGLGTFCNTKHKVHYNDNRKLPLKYYLLRCCSFLRNTNTVKQVLHSIQFQFDKYVLHAKIIFVF